jgi:hypothetical protein
MFSGHLEKTAISAAVGILIGSADAAGFFYTIKFLLAKIAPSKKIFVVFFEIFRLLFLVALIIFLGSHKIILFLPLLFTAFIVSLGGKMLLIFKGLNKRQAEEER